MADDYTASTSTTGRVTVNGAASNIVITGGGVTRTIAVTDTSQVSCSRRPAPMQVCRAAN